MIHGKYQLQIYVKNYYFENHLQPFIKSSCDKADGIERRELSLFTRIDLSHWTLKDAEIINFHLCRMEILFVFHLFFTKLVFISKLCKHAVCYTEIFLF